MKWFLDLTTRNKLIVCFGLIFALIAWVIATAYTGIDTISLKFLPLCSHGGESNCLRNRNATELWRVMR